MATYKSVETKYLDCVDKNYIMLALRHRIMLNGAKLLDKADSADIVVEVASGAVGSSAERCTACPKRATRGTSRCRSGSGVRLRGAPPARRPSPR